MLEKPSRLEQLRKAHSIWGSCEACVNARQCDARRLIHALFQAAKGLSIGSIWWEKAMEELER